MINLGRYPGTDLPNVKMQPRVLDWVMEAVSLMMWIAIMCILILYYRNMPEIKGNENYVLPVLSTVITLLFLWSSRAPTRYFNFPVRVTEQNYIIQYVLAVRFCRVISILLNAVFLFRMIGGTIPLNETFRGYLNTASFVMYVLLFISLLVYYIIARRYRIK